MDIGRVGEQDLIPTSEVDHPKQGSLRLVDDQVVVQPSNEHVVSRPGGGVGELGQQPRPAMASLRDRTVPRWQARGALAGALVTALAAGAAGGTLIGIGKGALIGAAVGSIVPGAGTVVGAVVGAVVAGVVGGLVASGIGALIGHLVAGGGGRDKAEKLTIGLLNEGKITAQEASKLKGMSNSELKDLVSISARKTGITGKADRDDVRRAVLLTAAKQGPDEARRLKTKLLKWVQVSGRCPGRREHESAPLEFDLGRDGDWPRAVAAEATMAEGKEEDFCKLTLRNLADSKRRSEDGLPPLAEQFWKDIKRQMRVTIVHSATDTATLMPQGKPQAELRKLVGSDEAAYQLSKFLSQTPLNSMVGAALVKDKGGRDVMPMLGVGTRTQGVTVTRQNDEMGKPVIDMSFAIEDELSGLAVDGQALLTQAGSGFRADMRLQIPLDDLQRGDLEAFRIVEPPRVRLRASVQPF